MMNTTEQETASAVDACAFLVITHEFGMDTSVHDSRKEAEDALLEYVQGWWANEAGEEAPIPKDPSEAIEAYFMDHAPQEDYEIRTPEGKGR